MVGFEISIVEYAFAGLVSLCCLFGGAVIKQDRGRIDDLEEKQEENGDLLHEIKGELKGLNNKVDAVREGLNDKMDAVKEGLDSKIDTVITLIKNGGKEI